MNKRLRKKKHVGEFDTLGFEIEVTWIRPLTPDLIEWILDDLIEWAEARHMGCGGVIGPHSMGHFFCKHKPPRRLPNGKERCVGVSCTEADRQALMDWVRRWEYHVGSFTVGPLVSSWK